MILEFDASTHPDELSQAETIRGRAKTEWVATEKSDFAKWIDANSEIRFLPIEGGVNLLRLHEPARLQVNYATRECRVIGWDVCVPLLKAHTLPREMARRFIDLFSKAQDDELSTDERNLWLSILDQVDYKSWSIERSAPHYMEGTLLRHLPVCRVEWHDGSHDNLEGQPREALLIFDPGEHFGAYVQLGRDNKVKAIKRISKISTF